MCTVQMPDELENSIMIGAYHRLQYLMTLLRYVQHNSTDCPRFTTNGDALPLVSQFKYLGHIVFMSHQFLVSTSH